MNLFQEALEKRFGATSINVHSTSTISFSIVTVQSVERKGVTFLLTNGLSEYEQPTTEKNKAHKHIELVFCLPSYWDLNDDIPTMSWVKNWIDKLGTHLIEKQTWYGDGHTFANGNPIEPLSPTMNQKYLMLVEPDFFATELSPIKIENKEVHFLCVIPLFEDEFDFKMGKGTFKLKKKLRDKGINELLDDFRMTALKNKWRIFK
jgi:hypothetical protein